MSVDSSQRMVLLSRLADEFAERYRQGERPPLQEYIDRHPELAPEIREFFPAMVEIEQVKENRLEVKPEPGLAPPLQQIGDYCIVREIGRGGMGVVYEAVQISLGRPVALKVLPHQTGSDARALERFRREARAAGRLHHTNIVPVFDSGVDGETCYFAMQFIPGQSLDQVVAELGQLRRAGPGREELRPQARAPSQATVTASTPPPSQAVVGLLSGQFRPPPALSEEPVARAERDWSSVEADHRHYFRSVARVGQQTAQALAYAHARGVVHRDIKPSNLLLDAAGVVWITDFGLARTEEEGLTHTGDIVGTLRYMAPERFNGQCDARADIYALGATLHELLVLQPAFNSPDRLRLLKQVQTQEPLRPRTLDPRIPRDLETIVLTAMHREPQGRYQTADELAADLERFLAGEPIRARRVTELERAWKWAQRYPWVAGLMAAVVLLLIAGTTVSLSFAFKAWGQEKKAKDAQAEAEAKEKQARLARAEAEKLQAHLALARGLSLCEQGEIEQGLLWLAHALELAQRAGASNLDRPLRVNLNDWSQQLPRRQKQWQHPGGCNRLAFSPDGRLIATAGQDGRVRFWDVARGTEDGSPLWLYFPPTHHQVWDVAFSPDGKTLLSAGADGKAVLWDVATRRRLHNLVAGRDTGDANVWSAVFSPDGSLVATAGPDEKVRLWKASSGKLAGAFGLEKYGLRSVAFSADGQFLYSGDFGGRLQRWNVSTREPIGSPLLQGTLVQSIKCSPDGKWGLAGGFEGGLHLWDCETLRQYPLPFQSVPVNAVAFSPDGRIFATSAGGVVRLWDSYNGRHVGPILRQDAIADALAFSPNGRILAVGEGGAIRLMTLPRLNGRLPLARRGWIKALSFDRAGRQLLVGRRDHWVLHDATKEDMPVRVGPTPTDQGQGQELRTAALSPDGRTLVTGMQQRVAVLWDVATCKPVARSGMHLGPVQETAFRADGAVLLTYSNRTSNPLHFWQIRAGLWDVPTGRLVRSLTGQPTTEVNQTTLAVDGRLLLLGCGDRTARIHDIQTNKPVGEPLRHASSVTAVAFRADGQRFLTGCRDGTLRLWDTTTRRLLAEPMRHSREVTACAFSPDGELILAADLEGVARFWDPGSGQPLGAPLRHAGAIPYLVFHPDGQRVVTAGRDECVRQWPVPPPPVSGSAEQVRRWIENLIGAASDESGAIRSLSSMDRLLE